MSYSPNLPVSGDTLGGTRDRIRTNFQEIDSVMAQNHVAFNNADEGKHKFLQMPVQAAAPATAASEAAFYVKDDGSGVAQFFVKGEQTGSEYQISTMTSGADAAIAEFGTNTAYTGNHLGGWTFLPGGLILQYGRYSKSDGTTSVVTFPRAFPNAVFNVTATRVDSRSVVTVQSVNTTTVTFTNGSGTSTRTIYWQAIGN